VLASRAQRAAAAQDDLRTMRRQHAWLQVCSFGARAGASTSSRAAAAVPVTRALTQLREPTWAVIEVYLS
jgi:hypothetical protein